MMRVQKTGHAAPTMRLR